MVDPQPSLGVADQVNALEAGRTVFVVFASQDLIIKVLRRPIAFTQHPQGRRSQSYRMQVQAASRLRLLDTSIQPFLSLRFAVSCACRHRSRSESTDGWHHNEAWIDYPCGRVYLRRAAPLGGGI